MANSTITGPFGEADRVRTLPVAHIAAMYRMRGGWDVTPHFHGHAAIDQYRCRTTGMLFWRPEDVAGDEAFYRQLASDEEHYYRTVRWEYGLLDRYLTRDVRLLEVGSGRGWFLKSTEGRVREASGLEFNTQAIADKVTTWPIAASKIEHSDVDGLDVVCSFHVLEHVIDPASFIANCLARLRPGGRLIISVPNHENIVMATGQDALDLPPHHVNHFTPDSLRRIAGHHGLTLERIAIEPRILDVGPATPATSARLGFKLARFLSRQLFRWPYRNEPGHSVLAVFRKPA